MQLFLRIYTTSFEYKLSISGTVEPRAKGQQRRSSLRLVDINLNNLLTIPVIALSVTSSPVQHFYKVDRNLHH